MNGKIWICECSKGFKSKYSLRRHRTTVCISSLRANDTKKTQRQENSIESDNASSLESISAGSNRRPSLRKANEIVCRALPKNNKEKSGHPNSVSSLDIDASGHASSISYSIRQYPSTAIPEVVYPQCQDVTTQTDPQHIEFRLVIRGGNKFVFGNTTNNY